MYCICGPICLEFIHIKGSHILSVYIKIYYDSLHDTTNKRGLVTFELQAFINKFILQTLE